VALIFHYQEKQKNIRVTNEAERNSKELTISRAENISKEYKKMIYADDL
jgi:hypothetical protein